MESQLKTRNQQRERRSWRVRKKLRGSAVKPRLSIFRSNRHVEAQLIDDEQHITLMGVSTLSKELKGAGRSRKELAREIGKRIAEGAKKKNITRAVFDRGRYKYHGVIAELAEGAREAGLKI